MDADTTTRALFAVPKKGRLYEQCCKLLESIHLNYKRSNRLDIALSSNMNVTLVFLPAADIPLYVGEGKVDLGITGQDMIAECDVKVEEVLHLGFGRCRLCVQAPIKNGIKDPKELAGKRIVTSFPHLSKKYFESVDATKATNIHYVSGSVEAACGLGLADGIVDLVETGDTMRAAGLEVVSEIMSTEAVLLKNPHTKHDALIAMIAKRIEGVLDANKYVTMEYNVPRSQLHLALKITPGKKSPTLCPLEDPDWVAVKCLVSKKESVQKMDELEAIGANDILIFDIQNCRV
eukprot:Colp12_sorted_trinity150504_noHs@36254